MKGVYRYQDFYAICHHRPDESRLRVGGTIEFVTSGWSAHLEERQGNTGINPRMLHLNLVLDPPEGAVEEVITAFEIPEWHVDRPKIEYDEVEFHVVGSEDEQPDIVRVDHVS